MSSGTERTVGTERNATGAYLVLAVYLASASTPVHAQQQPLPQVSFEVASIKPNVSPERFGRIESRGGRFTAVSASLRDLIRYAYGVRDFLIAEGPQWQRSDRFDVSATSTAAAVSPERMRQAVQQLLAERFSLSVHTERRELPFYALIMARRDRKAGPGLRPGTPECVASRNATTPAGSVEPPAGRPRCATRLGPGRFVALGVPLARLTDRLEAALERTVVDQTGLVGAFDIDLEYSPDLLAPVGDDRLSLYGALESQLGLKLDARRGPVDVLVVDRATRPDDN
jgi:uncharacterized protein (TIGR03435 family)